MTMSRKEGADAQMAPVGRRPAAAHTSATIMASWAAWAAGAIVLVGCSFLITIDVITRFLFKRGMVESFEISGYALAACIGLGLAFTVTSKANSASTSCSTCCPPRSGSSATSSPRWRWR